MYKKTFIIALNVLIIGCSSNNQLPDNLSTIQTVNMSTENYVDLYNHVVNAYIALEQGDYDSYDKNILGDDVCLTPNGGGSYFIGYDTKPILMYAFYDLNGNGILELLIGAELGGTDDDTRSNVFLTGIYGLRDSKPVSLIQVGTWSQLNIFADKSGTCIIKETLGTHIDYVEEHFYKIDENEALITLNKFYTYGKINNYNKVDDITYSHMKDVKGKEVSITEQEYFALMQKYGSVGYLDTISDLKPNEIVIDSWEPLAAYK